MPLGLPCSSPTLSPPVSLNSRSGRWDAILANQLIEGVRSESKGGKGKGKVASMGGSAVGITPKLGSESTNSTRMHGSPWVCSSSEGRAAEGVGGRGGEGDRHKQRLIHGRSLRTAIMLGRLFVFV